MKGRILTALVLLSLVPALSGCDFLRSLAGRPISADIEAKREAIAVHQAEEQARLDSISAAQKRQAQLEAAREEIPACGLNVIRPSEIRALSGVDLGFTYALMLGSFKNEENAVKLSSTLAGKGYGSALVRYNSGSVAVAASPTDDPVAFLSALGSLREEEFCPADAWVLLNE